MRCFESITAKLFTVNHFSNLSIAKMADHSIAISFVKKVHLYVFFPFSLPQRVVFTTQVGFAITNEA